MRVIIDKTRWVDILKCPFHQICCFRAELIVNCFGFLRRGTAEMMDQTHCLVVRIPNLHAIICSISARNRPSRDLAATPVRFRQLDLYSAREFPSGGKEFEFPAL